MAIENWTVTSDRMRGVALRPFVIPTVRPSELARQAGVSRQYVHAVITGKRPPSAKLLRAAAELGLPVQLIFGAAAETEACP
jgi:transcriptional regulator with XRE-family HTH domain